MAQIRKPPWYRQTEVIDRACAYVHEYHASLDVRDEGMFVQIAAQRYDALSRLIFESNTFENAGLSESDTRAVLAELQAVDVDRPARAIREIEDVLAIHPMTDRQREDVIRIDHRIAGVATGFVAPELVPAAMVRLEEEMRAARSARLPGSRAEVYEQAARFSHRLTAIHPFPDFNGRLSRLVLSVCVEQGGIPFPVSLKFDKKGRERYLYALKKGDKGDLRPMTVLVARAVVDGFEAIDAKVELAGLPRLLPVE